MMNMSQDAVGFLHRYEEEKDLQSGEIRLPHWNQMCQETRVSDLRKAPFCVKIQMTKLFAISSINYLMSKSEGSSPKALDMSIAQFKKRTNYLDFRVKVYDLYQHVAKTCPFCNSTEVETWQIACERTASGRTWRSYLPASWINPTLETKPLVLWLS